jgi:hypothetical protein
MANKKEKYTQEQIDREHDDYSVNTAHVFGVSQRECYGDVVVMLTSYENLFGGRTAFAQFNMCYTDQEALRYLEEATKGLKSKIAKKELAKV